MIEAPQSFVTRQECDKVAFQHGFRRPHGETDGWRRYSSTTAQGSIWLASGDAGWMLAIDHAGVVAEIGIEPAEVNGPGLSRFRFGPLGTLYASMPRVYELAISLPDAPLREFLQRTRDLPKETEAERLLVQRVGQSVFRERLMKYWQGRCPLTGIDHPALLRASHIQPWRDCETDEARLDVHNGLLLSALWDAAFDGGLVTFDDNGHPQFSAELGERAVLALAYERPLRLTDQHRAFLEWHRTRVFQTSEQHLC